MLVRSRSSSRRWIKFPIQFGTFSIIVLLKSKTRMHENLLNIVFSTLIDLLKPISNVRALVCSWLKLWNVTGSLSVTIETCHSLDKDLVSNDC